MIRLNSKSNITVSLPNPSTVLLQDIVFKEWRGSRASLVLTSGGGTRSIQVDSWYSHWWRLTSFLTCTGPPGWNRRSHTAVRVIVYGPSPRVPGGDQPWYPARTDPILLLLPRTTVAETSQNKLRNMVYQITDKPLYMRRSHRQWRHDGSTGRQSINIYFLVRWGLSWNW